MTAVVLRFGQSSVTRCALAEARDVETGRLVKFGPLQAIAAWLRREGYRWRVGSSGIWERI